MAGVLIKNNKLGTIAANLRPLASQVVRKAAFDLEGKEKEFAAVDTGFMRSSIQAEMTGEFTATVGVGAEYAPHVNYGTARQAAQPFVEPAVDVIRPGFEAAARQLVERSGG